jgi:DNA-binding NarL/FixJ family response regulator
MEIKILLAEDHDIVRDGIRALLESEHDLRVIGQASNGEEAFAKARELNPDVVIMDLNMPVMNGLDCTRKIKAELPKIKILVLSMHDHENYLIDLLDAGADGYVLKNTSKEELAFAIRKIYKDGIYMGPEFTLNMLQKYRTTVQPDRAEKKEQLNISDREMEVLNLVAQGKTNSEIARTLFTSVRTIETRRKNLLDKTQTNNTATLIRYAVKNGLVK